MEDFTGFTFGGVHSSDLGIIRVSGGDRYDEQLHPEIKDRTAEVPGLNGDYYFGSDFGPRSFDIEIAFDSLTEEQFRKLRRVFGTKDIKQLIFDERPYKYYMAKLESPMELSYVCFDESKKHIDMSGNAYGVRWIDETHTEDVIDEETGEPTGETIEVTERTRETIYPYVMDEGTQRIYKGEGKISFICHFPFAKSVYKVLPSEEEESSWAISSGILNSEDYSTVDIYENGQISLYNAGDLPVGFRLYLPANILGTGLSLNYRLNPDLPTVDASLVLDPITLKSNDNGIMIDTNTGLIMGVSIAPTFNPSTGIWNYAVSNNLYNEYISSGYFFKIKPSLEKYDRPAIQIENGTENIVIFYDYLYF